MVRRANCCIERSVRLASNAALTFEFRLSGFRIVGDCDLETDLTADGTGFDYFAIDGGVLAVVVESIEERMHKDAAFEKASIRAFLEEFMDIAFDILDVELRGGTYGPEPSNIRSAGLKMTEESQRASMGR